MKDIPRTKSVPIGTYILVKGINNGIRFEYIGKVYEDRQGNDRFTYLHNHTVVSIINSGEGHISEKHTYNVTPWEDVYIIKTDNDWIKILARAL